MKVADYELEQSPNDKREYKMFKLANEMRCLIISDPKADKSAGCMDVGVGYGHDPLEWFGLAHFLEHMLFMGTKKYPDENEYSEFMKNNGGYDNAFTSYVNTNYHFECSNAGFVEGLDRFA
jgi:insulysin